MTLPSSQPRDQTQVSCIPGRCFTIWATRELYCVCFRYTAKWFNYTYICACMHAKSLQSCLTLCNPVDCSLPGFSTRGILQTRILEWVAWPSPGDLPNLGIKSTSPGAPALPMDSFPTGPPGKPIPYYTKELLNSGQVQTLYFTSHFTFTLTLSEVRVNDTFKYLKGYRYSTEKVRLFIQITVI